MLYVTHSLWPFEGLQLLLTCCVDKRVGGLDRKIKRGKQRNMSDVMLLTMLEQLWSHCRPHYHTNLCIHQA